MNRILYVNVSGETGEEVPADPNVKGCQISKGRYVLVTPEELLDTIDPVYFEKPYYLAPTSAPSHTCCRRGHWGRRARARTPGS